MFSRISYWHGIQGGMDVHGKILTEGLARQGHRVSVICTRHPDGIVGEERYGVNLYYLKNTIFGSRRQGWMQESIKKCEQLHRQRPFDIILSQSFAAYGMRRRPPILNELPIVCRLPGSIAQELKTFRVNLRERWKNPGEVVRRFAGLLFSYWLEQKPLLSLADKLITASHSVTRDIEKFFGKRISRKCVRILNGIDCNHFKPMAHQRNALRNRYGIPQDAIILFAIGRLNKEKGFQIAIDVMKRLRHDDRLDVKLMIAGAGDYRQVLSRKIQRNGLAGDVILTGFVDNTDTVEYYNGADIFLMPTLTVEGLPFVLIEAMACGKPVIASRIGGNTTIVQNDRNGILVRAGSVDHLYESTKRLIVDDRLAAKFSRAARETAVNEFSSEKMVKETMNVIQNVR